MDQIKVGIIGVGQFAGSFIPLFQHHPGVSAVSIAEPNEERRTKAQKEFGIREAYQTGEELMRSDVDAVAVFTPRHTHFPFSKLALETGKHIYSAVPIGNSLEEIHDLIELVRRSGQIYMMGETSHYYPQTVYCRKRYQAGDFGRIVYAEAEYMHDMDSPGCSFYEVYQKSHGDDWRRYAGIPPMHYPTHSFAMVLSVTGARVKRLSCFGLDDTAHEDRVWGPGKNQWDNPFSNQSALCQLSDGSVARINEFRRVGSSHTNHVRLSLFGDKAVFEEQAGHSDLHRSHMAWVTQKGDMEDPNPEIDCPADVHAGGDSNRFVGIAPIHDTDLLPETYRGLRNGHYGSHQFLINDFVSACLSGKTPVNNIWDAARYNAPGFIAHESSLRDGETMEVPDFGNAPE